MEFYFNKKWEIPNCDIIGVFKKLEDGFLILNKSEKEYLQLLHLDIGYTIELRELFNSILPRQYRIGKKPVDNEWNYLNSRSGLISLKKSEILSKEDCEKILKCYLNESGLDEFFYKRNISREIGLINH